MIAEILRFAALTCIVVIANAAELRSRRVQPMTSRQMKNTVKAQNAMTFPSSPKYGVIANYLDTNCASFGSYSTFLLDTCLVGNSSSVKYTCGTV